MFVGLQFTTASRMVVFVYLAPFVVALGMPFIARAERLGALPMAGLVAAFGGVAWAFAEGLHVGQQRAVDAMDRRRARLSPQRCCGAAPRSSSARRR